MFLTKNAYRTDHRAGMINHVHSDNVDHRICFETIFDQLEVHNDLCTKNCNRTKTSNDFIKSILARQASGSIGWM